MGGMTLGRNLSLKTPCIHADKEHMNLNQKGFGFIDMILAIGALLTVAYLVLNQASSNGVIESREKLKAHGVEIPKNLKLENAPKIGQEMSKQITEPIDKTSAQMKCKLEGGTDCGP
jgi:hypothetical protein